MTDTQPIGQLAAALAKAQAQIKNAVKDAANPAFKRDGKNSTYADLASVWDACRAALTSNDIAVIQKVMGGPETVTVATVIAHKSGEIVECSVTGKPTKPDVQGLGSTITYLRRYSLASMVGVAPEDDDGNASAGIGGDSQQTTTKTEKAAVAAAETQKPKDGLCLETDNGPTYHATVSAYLDAFESGLKESEDRNAFFDRNAEVIQAQQAKAAKVKGNKQAEVIVGRIKAIFDEIHAGPVPNLAAE